MCQTTARNVKHIIFKEFHVNVVVDTMKRRSALSGAGWPPFLRLQCTVVVVVANRFIGHRVVRRCLFCVEPHKQFQLEFFSIYSKSICRCVNAYATCIDDGDNALTCRIRFQVVERECSRENQRDDARDRASTRN